MTRRPPRFPAALHPASPAAVAATLLRPQRLLHDAARAAAQQASPQAAAGGLGLDSAAVRTRMVARLREAGITNEEVLGALAAVPRHRFVDAALANQAYEDTALPIGWGQTISKPSVVARMLALLAAGRNACATGSLGSVLEIGTGCGYQAALLARLARRVISVERLEPLFARSRENLGPLRPAHLRLVFGDGMRGHPPNAPYDSIVAAAGGEALPQAWLDQLADGGRLVAPLHDAAAGGQALIVVDRDGEKLNRQRLEAVRFVPLKSGTARG